VRSGIAYPPWVSCVQCGRQVEAAFRYCPWCGTVQRSKLVEFFLGHATIDHGRSLRVSRYLRTRDQEPHVRFSVWNEEGEAQAAVSIDEHEAGRLSGFLRPQARPRRLRDVLEQLIPHSSD
jgi:hypothetical protein